MSIILFLVDDIWIRTDFLVLTQSKECSQNVFGSFFIPHHLNLHSPPPLEG